MSGGRAVSAMEVDKVEDQGYQDQLMAMVQDLQTRLDQALCVTGMSEKQVEEEEDEELLGYAAIVGEAAGMAAGQVHKLTRVQVEQKNAPAVAKLPRSFVQKVGGVDSIKVVAPVPKLGMLSAEQMIVEVLKAPYACICLEDMGVDRDAVKTQLVRWMVPEVKRVYWRQRPTKHGKK